MTVAVPALPVALSAAPQVEQVEMDKPIRLSSRRRILVADDNVDSAQSLGLLLELHGNDLITANDGLKAVEIAETFRPDVILLDIGMPHLVKPVDDVAVMKLLAWKFPAG